MIATWTKMIAMVIELAQRFHKKIDVRILMKIPFFKLKRKTLTERTINK